jgi:all-trans-8'-apo-beta-carotenal 15,15'-oxygenase
MSKTSRRDFLKSGLATTALLGIAPSAAFATSSPRLSSDLEFVLSNADREPISASAFRERAARLRLNYAGLVTSLKSESTYDCVVEGNLPLDINGTLVRNGPGIFERQDQRRRLVIDADGMLRHFRIANGKARFSNRHIRTEKFRAEEKAGKYLYPSFAMLLPNKGLNPFANSLINIKNQASVTTFYFGGRLFASDEMRALTELDPSTLKTIGEVSPTGEKRTYLAHGKITNFGKKELHLVESDPRFGTTRFCALDEKFQVLSKTEELKLGRSFHDWMVTPNFYVIALPPQSGSGAGIAKAIAGLSTAADATVFDKSAPTKIAVIPRNGSKILYYNLPKALESWHSVAAYEDQAGKVILDFLASPPHDFETASSESDMAKIMSGTLDPNGGIRSTSYYRVALDYGKKSAAYRAGYYPVEGLEMPTIDQTRIGQKWDSAYFVSGRGGVDTKLVRIDARTRAVDEFEFGPNQFVTEPIFAPSTTGGAGYVLSEIYSAQTQKSYLAVMNADSLKSGPIARVWLQHHLPIGFHGFWLQA